MFSPSLCTSSMQENDSITSGTGQGWQEQGYLNNNLSPMINYREKKPTAACTPFFSLFHLLTWIIDVVRNTRTQKVILLRLFEGCRDLHPSAIDVNDRWTFHVRFRFVSFTNNTTMNAFYTHLSHLVLGNRAPSFYEMIHPLG